MSPAPLLPRAPKRLLTFPTRADWIVILTVIPFTAFTVVSFQHRSRAATHRWLVVCVVLLVILFVWAVVYSAWNQRRLRRFNVLCYAALDLLARGELGLAHERLEALEREWPRPRAVSLALKHNLGWTRLRQGKLRASMETFAELDARRRRKEKGGLWSKLAGHMACAHALVGESGAAQTWLEELKQRTVPGDYYDRSSVCAATLARAIIACRGSHFTEAARELARDWFMLEHQFTGELLRPMRAVRAFALAKTGIESDASSAESQLVPLREGPPNELAFLGAEWPEMREFLAQHGLAGNMKG